MRFVAHRFVVYAIRLNGKEILLPAEPFGGTVRQLGAVMIREGFVAGDGINVLEFDVRSTEPGQVLPAVSERPRCARCRDVGRTCPQGVARSRERSCKRQRDGEEIGIVARMLVQTAVFWYARNFSKRTRIEAASAPKPKTSRPCGRFLFFGCEAVRRKRGRSHRSVRACPAVRHDFRMAAPGDRALY